MSLHRERFRLTLDHKPVDRCPIDLGGTPQSTVDAQSVISNLTNYLGFSGERPTDFDKFDRRILEHWDIDFRRVGELITFENKYTQAESNGETVDGFGLRYKYTGLYWEIVDSPIMGASKDAVAAYEFPTIDQATPGLLDDRAARAKQLHEETGYVIAAEHPVYGVLETACWLCGYDHIMLMFAADPEFIHLLFGKILDYQKNIIRAYYEKLGPYIHMTTSGDDFGTQKGLFISPAMWREFVKPYMRQRIEYTAKFTDAVYMHHTCGAVFDIIPDLIEIGVKILNPIQPAASGMDPRRLKETFGKDIVFHGGLDTQEVLPSGDAKHIGNAVENLLDIMHPWTDGGYIFAPAHNIQVDVSPGSIAHMYDTVFRCLQEQKEDRK
ncbi:MAG: uroporphyrinogen decarboxylase family protein [Armatimonadota bacterium]